MKIMNNYLIYAVLGDMVIVFLEYLEKGDKWKDSVDKDALSRLEQLAYATQIQNQDIKTYWNGQLPRT